jgi:hypothetical protein
MLRGPWPRREAEPPLGRSGAYAAPSFSSAGVEPLGEDLGVIIIAVRVCK